MTYRVEDAVITTTDADGGQLSSVSAPRIQAMQIEQADIGPGTHVLEIGSGGVNAAYLAEILGEDGLVTADIDHEVTERAQRFLTALPAMSAGRISSRATVNSEHRSTPCTTASSSLYRPRIFRPLGSSSSWTVVVSSCRSGCAV
ncbi:hypothetical protein ACWGBX_08640 [Streptomyces sp. NPDC055037]